MKKKILEKYLISNISRKFEKFKEKKIGLQLRLVRTRPVIKSYRGASRRTINYFVQAFFTSYLKKFHFFFSSNIRKFLVYHVSDVYLNKYNLYINKYSVYIKVTDINFDA